MSNPVLRGGVGSPQSIFEASSTQYHGLGTQGYLDERTFRYASSVESGTLGGGLLLKPVVEAADHNSVAWAAGGAIGSNKITVTLGATAATANFYADGWLIVIDGTGSAQGARRIKEHPAANASATLELTLYNTFEVAVVTGSEISLVANEFKNVLVHTGDDSPAIGVTTFTVPAGSTTTQYFWVQTGGPAAVQGDASAFIYGDRVVPADVTTDDGQVTILAGTTVAAVLNLQKRPDVGRVISVGDTSDLDFVLVHLTLED